MCVAHLYRCKTSGFQQFSAGGAGGTDETGTNKDTHQLPVISMGTLIDVPAYTFSVMGRGSTQEPPCCFYIFTALLPQSILDDDLFAGFNFGVWFGLHWTFSEDRHYIHEVQP